MAVDVEQELRAAMHEATESITAGPLLVQRITAEARPRQVRDPWLHLVAAAACVGVLGAGAVGVSRAWHDQPEEVTGIDAAGRPADVLDAWGPTRGDLATDESFLAQVRQEWTAPAQSTVRGLPTMSNPQGEPHVLWAGRTPDGPAAVVAQVDASPDGPANPYLVTEVLLPDEDGQARLPGTAGGEELPGSGFDPDAIVFSPSPSGRTVVVIPADPEASVSVSPGLLNEATDDVRREWTSTPLDPETDAAVVDLGAGHVRGTELVEVHSAGEVVVRGPVIVAPGPLPAGPDNLVEGWTACDDLCRHDAELADGASDPTRAPETEQAWLAHRDADGEWVRRGEWDVIGSTADGGSWEARQLYLHGEPAHTVVAYARPGGETTVLHDEVTDPDERPVLGVRLPDGNGWLVGAGPDSTLGQWRAVGGAWSDETVDQHSYVVPSAADRIEVEVRTASGVEVVTLSD